MLLSKSGERFDNEAIPNSQPFHTIAVGGSYYVLPTLNLVKATVDFQYFPTPTGRSAAPIELQNGLTRNYDGAQFVLRAQVSAHF